MAGIVEIKTMQSNHTKYTVLFSLQNVDYFIQFPNSKNREKRWMQGQIQVFK